MYCQIACQIKDSFSAPSFTLIILLTGSNIDYWQLGTKSLSRCFDSKSALSEMALFLARMKSVEIGPLLYQNDSYFAQLSNPYLEVSKFHWTENNLWNMNSDFWKATYFYRFCHLFYLSPKIPFYSSDYVFEIKILSKATFFLKTYQFYPILKQ